MWWNPKGIKNILGNSKTLSETHYFKHIKSSWTTSQSIVIFKEEKTLYESGRNQENVFDKLCSTIKTDFLGENARYFLE